mmetsp:Transcript_654/g.1387  ORF Transcript_654/g.1387 Transcript_654/m.1387 type:complete len:276 (-) Transcript_654:981-1808(-)
MRSLQPAHDGLVQLAADRVPLLDLAVDLGLQPCGGCGIAGGQGPDRELGMRLEAAEAAHGFLEALTGLGAAGGAGIAAGQQQQHLIGPELRPLGLQRLQVGQGGGKALAFDRGPGGAEAQVGVAGEGALERAFVQLRRLGRIACVQQGLGQAHLVLRGGRDLKRRLGLAHVAPGVEGPGRVGHGLQRAPLQPGVRQVDREEVDRAAQQREGEQDDEPIQLLAAAHDMNRAEQRDQDVQASDQWHRNLPGGACLRRLYGRCQISGRQQTGRRASRA